MAWTFDLSSATLAPGYEMAMSRQRKPWASEDLVRLFWTLQGPLEESVSVMRDKHSPHRHLEPYHERTLDGDSWHPISEKPVTSPPVSNLFVDVYQLAEWEGDWVEMHSKCVGGGRFFRDDEGSDYETEDEVDEYDTGHKLVRCCHQDRPPPSTKLEVRASSQPFVTVHDYLTAVHPWLMRQREKLLRVMNVADEFASPLPEDTRLAVNVNGPECLIIDEVDHWKAITSRGRGVVAQNIPVSGQPFTTVEQGTGL